jgi:hypothetical protein
VHPALLSWQKMLCKAMKKGCFSKEAALFHVRWLMAQA